MPQDGYSRIHPHSRGPSISDRAVEEMEMAFESDDEDQHLDTTPLTRNHSAVARNGSSSPTNILGPAPAYDFERDYDYPPSGSPPGSSTTLSGTAVGNSNGIIPTFVPIQTSSSTSSQSRPSLLRRAVGALLPQHYARVPTSETSDASARIVGGGIENDGVFSNVLAKPSAPATVETQDGIQVMPEDAQKDAPPSYAAAQADAVPPYWETTIHAPSYGNGDEILIEGIPAGTIFSFAWNFLISISFQFVGFMLTYLLHTSHAGKYGSRAGLGVTLIQYGLYSRDPDNVGFVDVEGDGGPADFVPAATATPKRGYSVLYPRSWGWNSMQDAPPPDGAMQTEMMNSAHDWLSFLLMTLGWFLLLSSILGYARVKRWERSIRTSQPQMTSPSPDEVVHDARVRSHIHRVFGLDFADEDDDHTNHVSRTPPVEGEQSELRPTSEQEERFRRSLRAIGFI